MATATDTVTNTLVLTPPAPVPVVTAEKAAGLVPVYDATRTKLD